VAASAAAAAPVAPVADEAAALAAVDYEALARELEGASPLEIMVRLRNRHRLQVRDVLSRATPEP
jgi:hypothetical protein